MEEVKSTPDFNYDKQGKIDRARVINRVLYCVGPCHEENLFEYIEGEDREQVRKALDDLLEQKVLAKIKDPDNLEKSIIQVPIKQYSRAQAIVKDASGANGKELLLSIPPVIISKWETELRLLGKDDAGEVTHTIRGRVNWNFWETTTFTIYSTDKKAFKDLDISLKSLKSKHKLSLKCKFNADKYKKYLIRFEPIIQAGEDFAYVISYKIRNTFKLEEDWYEHIYAHSENSLSLKIYFPEGTIIDKAQTKAESHLASPGGAILPLDKLWIGNNGSPKICLKLDCLPQGTQCKIKWFTTKE